MIFQSALETPSIDIMRNTCPFDPKYRSTLNSKPETLPRPLNPNPEQSRTSSKATTGNAHAPILLAYRPTFLAHSPVFISH